MLIRRSLPRPPDDRAAAAQRHAQLGLFGVGIGFDLLRGKRARADRLYGVDHHCGLARRWTIGRVIRLRRGRRIGRRIIATRRPRRSRSRPESTGLLRRSGPYAYTASFGVFARNCRDPDYLSPALAAIKNGGADITIHQGDLHESVRFEWQSCARHRLDQGHRRSDRPSPRRARRKSCRLEPQGRRLRQGRRRHQQGARQGSRCAHSLQHQLQGTVAAARGRHAARNGARSTSSSAMPR